MTTSLARASKSEFWGGWASYKTHPMIIFNKLSPINPINLPLTLNCNSTAQSCRCYESIPTRSQLSPPASHIMPNTALPTSRPRVTIRAEVGVLNNSITGASKYLSDVPELRDNQRRVVLYLSNPDRPYSDTLCFVQKGSWSGINFKWVN